VLTALVFDFDGLILDTETPEMVSWQEEFESAGVQLDRDRWITWIGTYAGVDLYDELSTALGAEVDRETVRASRQERYARLIATEEVRPGVLDYLARADELGLRLGVASSSTNEWVRRHLTTLGLEGRFHSICGRDDVGGVAKPAPDVYLEVLRRLGVEAEDAVALEDSPNGVRAAKAAAISCVYVPNGLTRSLACDEADLCVDSLADMPLAELMATLPGRPGTPSATR